MKKAQSLWYAFGAIAIIALLIIFFKTQPQAQIPENKTISEPTGIQFGDLVSINFVLSLENGTIVDTNNEELALKNGITNYVKGPYTFILGQSGKVPGFDKSLIGMEINQTKELTIEPSEDEIILTVNKTKTQRRHVTINKKQPFPLTAFERFFNKKPIVGDVVKSPEFAFTYKVLNITEKHVITEMVLKEGEKYVLPNTEWNSSVVRVAEEDALFYQQPTENQTLTTPFGPAKINFTGSMMFINFEPELNTVFNKSIEVGQDFTVPAQFQVIAVAEDTFTIKRYGLLTDKKLVLKAELLDATKNVKKVRTESKIKTETVSA